MSTDSADRGISPAELLSAPGGGKASLPGEVKCLSQAAIAATTDNRKRIPQAGCTFGTFSLPING